MQKLVLIVLGVGVALGLMVPGEEPKPKAAAVAKTPSGGLFDAPTYKETELERKPNGHFYVTADVNGAPINFIVDTGASVIALTEEDARSAGLEFSSSEFEPVARTASGVAKGKIVTLPKVSIDGKEVMEVEAMILEGAEISLLGQSYLARISGVQMNGDRMVLR
jgi:aspartyl protease family protein